MKPVVVMSVNDATETRCVDVRREEGGFSWVECRGDPEDGHGWRIIGGPARGFASVEAAWQAVVRDVAWVAVEHPSRAPCGSA
ncbi:MAG: hypothetical protein AAF376_10270 [Pseudomonadota bacterium]